MGSQGYKKKLKKLGSKAAEYSAEVIAANEVLHEVEQALGHSDVGVRMTSDEMLRLEQGDDVVYVYCYKNVLYFAYTDVVDIRQDRRLLLSAPRCVRVLIAKHVGALIDAIDAAFDKRAKERTL